LALFVLIIVGLVVGLTWMDWRDSLKGFVVPNWAKGMALGGVVAASLAAAASFASVWLRDAATQMTGGIITWRFWVELAFLAAVLGLIVLAARRKRIRWMLFVACLLACVVWIGMIL
jgi:hypothetical protein